MAIQRVVAALAALALAAPAGAQSFGRNKVHYDSFDFQVLETPHFDIYYYPAEHEASVQAGRLAERWYARLSSTLGHTFKERQPILLYGSHARFTQTNVVPGMLNDGIGGVTEHLKGRVVLPFAASLGETDHVLGHELVHAFQRDILRRHGNSIAAQPLWFVEGMAESLSVGRIDSNTAMWLRDAVEQNRLPRIDQLDDPRWFPYRYGQALWVYLAQRFGDEFAATCLKSKIRGRAVKRLAALTGVDGPTLSSQWHEWIREVVARPPLEPNETPASLTVNTGAGRLNVGPVLSPDGQSIVYFSDRDRYSVDVVLADAATGAVHQRIVRTAGDPHFESLQFIESAGAWEPYGRRFALAALSAGRAVLTILNTETGAVERELPIRDVDQIFSPTWSPDGRRIAFSAIRNGFSDLYVVDLDTASVRALTSDAFADLQPSWSPDGLTIAFSTDRFSSSLETLTFGALQLGLIDAERATISELSAIPGAKNIDPHWSADGKSLYFVADDHQISNIYRIVIADGQVFRMTDVSTGVSGVTASSPALTVAGESNRIAFSVYRKGAYEIRVMDEAAGTAASSAIVDDVQKPEAMPVAPMSPAPAGSRLASATVAMPTFGLTDGSQFTSKRYHPALSLNRIVQPYLSAGGGGSNSFLRAGAGLTFGDMLGDHEVQTALQIGKSVDDFAVQASYLNRHSRWNWAVVGGQVPWVTGVTQQSVARGAAGATLTRQTDLFRQLHREMAGMIIYPFSRSKRLELSSGVQSVAFGHQSTTREYAFSGQLVNQITSNTAAPSATLVESGAALVYDSTVFGATSPVLGQRYRFSVQPTFGHLSFTSVTADYRRYLMPVRPVTIAMRVMHLGRYGSGADDPRLLPLVWTLRDSVRGYGDRGPRLASFGDLRDSRMVIGNLELRVPVESLIRRTSNPGQLPLEGIVFYDSGSFWTPAAGIRDSKTLRSAGAGVRVNGAGMVFEFDVVRPFDVPSRGWTFSFNFRPGF